MFRNSYQGGMLSIFYAGGHHPLAIWDARLENGNISRFLDQDIKAMVLEIRGTNVSTSYITCPKGSQVLGITLPFLIMIVKNLKKYFSFEITIMDQTGVRRRFRVSNFQSKTQIQPLCTVMPIGLCDGWNQIQFNLADFTTRAYRQQFREVQKVKINANIRLRRIYFADRLIPEDELPPAYKLFFPIKHRDHKKEGRKVSQEKIKGSKADVITDIKQPSAIMEAIKNLQIEKEKEAERIPVEEQKDQPEENISPEANIQQERKVLLEIKEVSEEKEQPLEDVVLIEEEWSGDDEEEVPPIGEEKEPMERKVSTEVKAPSQEKLPLEGEVPQKEQVLQEETPLGVEAPLEEEVPQKEQISQKDELPQKEEIPQKEEVPLEEIITPEDKNPPNKVPSTTAEVPTAE